jgi:hypothetical protein
MEESYIEDLANHGGPEPCVGVPRGRSEALVRGARRRAIEPRNVHVWGADAVAFSGRQHRWRRFREPSVDLAGSKNLCMRAISLCSRTGRAHGRPWLVDDAPPYTGRGVAYWLVAGRAGNTEVVIP